MSNVAGNRSSGLRYCVASARTGESVCFTGDDWLQSRERAVAFAAALKAGADGDYRGITLTFEYPAFENQEAIDSAGGNADDEAGEEANHAKDYAAGNDANEASNEESNDGAEGQQNSQSRLGSQSRPGSQSRQSRPMGAWSRGGPWRATASRVILTGERMSSEEILEALHGEAEVLGRLGIEFAGISCQFGDRVLGAVNHRYVTLYYFTAS